MIAATTSAVVDEEDVAGTGCQRRICWLKKCSSHEEDGSGGGDGRRRRGGRSRRGRSCDDCCRHGHIVAGE